MIGEGGRGGGEGGRENGREDEEERDGTELCWKSISGNANRNRYSDWRVQFFVAVNSERDQLYLVSVIADYLSSRELTQRSCRFFRNIASPNLAVVSNTALRRGERDSLRMLISPIPRRRASTDVACMPLRETHTRPTWRSTVVQGGRKRSCGKERERTTSSSGDR